MDVVLYLIKCEKTALTGGALGREEALEFERGVVQAAEEPGGGLLRVDGGAGVAPHRAQPRLEQAGAQAQEQAQGLATRKSYISVIFVLIDSRILNWHALAELKMIIGV
jgi:hypothetical protein